MFLKINSAKNSLQNKWAIWLMVGILLVQFSTYILLGESQSFLEVHDNLDSVLVWLKMMSDSHLFFSQNVEIPMLNGMNRIYFPSEFQVANQLFNFMSLYNSYISLYFLKVILGCFSFLLLFKEVYPRIYTKNVNLVLLVAFSFSLLPGSPILYFAQVSIPLLIYLLIRSYKNLDYKILLLLLLYPILSEFPRYGIFILGFLAFFILLFTVINRKTNINLILSFVVLSIGYFLTEYRLFTLILFSDASTLREEMISPLGNTIELFFRGFTKGQYHAQSMHETLILRLSLIYLVYKNFIYIKNKNFNGIFRDRLNIIFLFITFNSIVYALYGGSQSVRDLVVTILPPLKGFNFGRTIWFNPFLWHILFLMVLIEIKEKTKVFEILFIFIAIAQIGIVLTTQSYANDFIRTVYNTLIRDNNRLSYGSFFSEELFNKIKKDIKYNNENSVAFGFHPSILQYNKIVTLDGYNNYYSLAYKREFRKIISPVLDKNGKWKKYFDNWGGRAYIFPITSESIYEPIKKTKKESYLLNINTEAFKSLGGVYIFSRYKIPNAKDNNLKLIKKYTDKSSPYSIYLYTTDSSGSTNEI